jgi:hypothetical protein
MVLLCQRTNRRPGNIVYDYIACVPNPTPGGTQAKIKLGVLIRCKGRVISPDALECAAFKGSMMTVIDEPRYTAHSMRRSAGAKVTVADTCHCRLKTCVSYSSESDYDAFAVAL